MSTAGQPQKAYEPSGKRTRRSEEDDDDNNDEDEDEVDEDDDDDDSSVDGTTTSAPTFPFIMDSMFGDEMVKFSGMVGEKAKPHTALAHYRLLGNSGLRVSPCLSQLSLVAFFQPFIKVARSFLSQHNISTLSVPGNTGVWRQLECDDGADDQGAGRDDPGRVRGQGRELCGHRAQLPGRAERRVAGRVDGEEGLPRQAGCRGQVLAAAAQGRHQLGRQPPQEPPLRAEGDAPCPPH